VRYRTTLFRCGRAEEGEQRTSLVSNAVERQQEGLEMINLNSGDDDDDDESGV